MNLMLDDTIKVAMLLKWWVFKLGLLDKSKYEPFRVKEPNVNLTEERQAP